VLAPLAAGERLIVNGVKTMVTGAISLGHKLAARPIAAGEKVIKYGAPIGSATRDIACGEHVHTHNLKSDYLPTFLHEDQPATSAQTPAAHERLSARRWLGRASATWQWSCISSNARITWRARSCFRFVKRGVHLLGFPGCFPNAYAHRMLRQLCTHPNVGAVLLVSLGCEGFNRRGLLDEIRATGRPRKPS
jgi:altronate hydrolase